MKTDKKTKRKASSLKNDAKFALHQPLEGRARLRFFTRVVENLSGEIGILGCHRAALINYRLEKSVQSKTPR
jgi:hypothetical protein